MRAWCFLLYVVVLVVIVVAAVLDTFLAMPRQTKSLDNPLDGVSSTVESVTTRFLRAEIEAAITPVINDVAGTKGFMSPIVEDVWTRLKMKGLAIQGVKPEDFMKRMQIASADKEKFRQHYDRYFYKYYNTHVEVELPKKHVDEIGKARLDYWLAKGLTYPQVRDLLKKVPRDSLPKFNVYQEYADMWGREQVRLSKIHNGG